MDRKAREDQKTQGVQTARYVDDDDLLDTGLETMIIRLDQSVSFLDTLETAGGTLTMIIRLDQ